jgi:hypothetical protein
MRRLSLLFLLAAVHAQGATPEATVGMRSRIEELVLPGTELVPAPVKAEDPIVVRILAVRAHGNEFRYDLEWSGLEPGSYDLAKFLARKDGSTTPALPAIPVVVKSLLPKSVKEPGDLKPVAPPELGGYRTQQIVVGVVWGVGLLAILFVGRKRRKVVLAVAAKPTLADRLRPIVEAVAAGRAEDTTKAELERLLVTFWRHRLGLREQKAGDAIQTIRQHAEAGQLLRQLEAWLHMPRPPEAVDLQALLAPYRNVSAEDFAELAKPVEAT